MRGFTYCIIELHEPGPHVPEHGMGPGVRGCSSGKILGYQIVGFSGRSPRACFYGWVFPTFEEAKKERDKKLRWSRDFERKRQRRGPMKRKR